MEKTLAFILQRSWHTGLWKYRPSPDNRCQRLSNNLQKTFCQGLGKEGQPALQLAFRINENWHVYLQAPSKRTFEYFLLIAHSRFPTSMCRWTSLMRGPWSNDGRLVDSLRARSPKWEGPVGFESKRCHLLVLANLFNQSPLLLSFYKWTCNPSRRTHRSSHDCSDI